MASTADNRTVMILDRVTAHHPPVLNLVEERARDGLVELREPYLYVHGLYRVILVEPPAASDPICLDQSDDRLDLLAATGPLILRHFLLVRGREGTVAC
jgi:hypothetical protein